MAQVSFLNKIFALLERIFFVVETKQQQQQKI